MSTLYQLVALYRGERPAIQGSKARNNNGAARVPKARAHGAAAPAVGNWRRSITAFRKGRHATFLLRERQSPGGKFRQATGRWRNAPPRPAHYADAFRSRSRIASIQRPAPRISQQAGPPARVMHFYRAALAGTLETEPEQADAGPPRPIRTPATTPGVVRFARLNRLKYSLRRVKPRHGSGLSYGCRRRAWAVTPNGHNRHVVFINRNNPL